MADRTAFDWQIIDALRQQLIELEIPLHYIEYPEWKARYAAQVEIINQEHPPAPGFGSIDTYDGPPLISLGGFWHIELVDGDFTVSVEANEYPGQDDEVLTDRITLVWFRISANEPDAIEQLIHWLQHELPKARAHPSERPL